MQNAAWSDIIIAGWPVLSVLLISSIITIAVAWENWNDFSKVQADSTAFLDSVRKARDAEKIIAFCDKSNQPLAYITAQIYKASNDREEKERTLQRAIQAVVHRLETKIAVLGTIASVAPFVGLLGTVIGIIRAFKAVSASASGGASAVALGISEALIGTAAGLVVAIPALLFYNYYSNKIRRLIQEWEIAGSEIIDLSLKSGRG